MKEPRRGGDVRGRQRGLKRFKAALCTPSTRIASILGYSISVNSVALGRCQAQGRGAFERIQESWT